jgi:hypothetical protein
VQGFTERDSVSVEEGVDMKRIDPEGVDTVMKMGYHLQIYEELFEPLIGKEISLLELGVDQGKSLLLYRDYFEKASIAGLDINPIQIEDPTGRIRVYVGYQQDIALLTSIAKEQAPNGFDVIIDDCSHIAEPTRISFWHLFVHHLKPGGIYAIEDIGTGYMDDWVDGWHYKAPHLPIQSLPNSSCKPSTAIGRTTLSDDNSYVSLVDSLIIRFKQLLPDTIFRSFAKSERFLRLYRRLRKLTSPYRYRRSIPSHMYGMVGFVKELTDVCALGSSIGGVNIHKIQISRNLVIVIKGQPGE